MRRERKEGKEGGKEGGRKGEPERSGGGAAMGPTSSMADSSMKRGASQERMPCVAMTKIL